MSRPASLQLHGQIGHGLQLRRIEGAERLGIGGNAERCIDVQHVERLDGGAHQAAGHGYRGKNDVDPAQQDEGDDFARNVTQQQNEMPGEAQPEHGFVRQDVLHCCRGIAVDEERAVHIAEIERPGNDADQAQRAGDAGEEKGGEAVEFGGGHGRHPIVGLAGVSTKKATAPSAITAL